MVLTTTSLIDRLHWEIIGTEGKQKASLIDLIRPHGSPIVNTQAAFVRLLSDWSSQGWPLLHWLGFPASSRDKQLMGFARAIVARLSAGVFLCAEMRFACYPYRLLRAEFENPSLLAGLDRVRPCCLGPFWKSLPQALRPEVLSTVAGIECIANVEWGAEAEHKPSGMRAQGCQERCAVNGPGGVASACLQS